MVRLIALVLILFSSEAHGGTQPSRTDTIEPISTVGQYTDHELQAFDVYDDVTESIFESFRLYHPYECRNCFVRKVRADGMTYVDKVRRCD